MYGTILESSRSSWSGSRGLMCCAEIVTIQTKGRNPFTKNEYAIGRLILVGGERVRLLTFMSKKVL